MDDEVGRPELTFDDRNSRRAQPARTPAPVPDLIVSTASSLSPTPAPPAIFTGDTLPPMSFQEAKVLLHSHIEREGYLEQALRELDALKTTKAIKQASAAHIKKAAQDFDGRKKWKVRG